MLSRSSLRWEGPNDLLYGRAYSIQIPLNPKSAMYADISGIYHHPGSSSIRVVLEESKNRTHFATAEACLRPYLIARLSGPSIGLISQWDYRRGRGNASSVMEGRYAVPFPGMYFLEIVVIHCNRYNETELRQAHYLDDKTEFSFLKEEQYVNQKCVVNPAYNRLTAENVSIAVSVATTPADASENEIRYLFNATHATPGRLGGKIRGSWVRNLSALSIQPLYTRSQVEPDLAGLSPYQFMWTVSNEASPAANEEEKGTAFSSHLNRRLVTVSEEYLIDLVRAKARDRINDTFCLVGDSHVAVLVKHLQGIVHSRWIRVNAFYVSQLSNLSIALGYGDLRGSTLLRITFASF
jgi:hypothetical protein